MTTLTKNTDLLKQKFEERNTKWPQSSPHTRGHCWDDCLQHDKILVHSDGQGYSKQGPPAPVVEPYGIPLSLVRIAENIFDYLPTEEGQQFFALFPHAIGVDGKDLSLVQWQFLSDALRHLPPQEPDIQAVISPVIDGLDLLASGGIWEDAAAAAKAANTAKYDPSCFSSGIIRERPWRQHTAAGAAESAASAATLAPDARAAEAAGFVAGIILGTGICDATEPQRQQDSLLRLIREAPVVTPS